MKIIDLLNKIANGEEVPKTIKLDNYVFEFNKTYEQYHNKYETNLLEHISDYNYSGLNDEVEIIEEEKEIERLNLDTNELKGKETVRAIDYLLESKINELIDELKKLKEDK